MRFCCALIILCNKKSIPKGAQKKSIPLPFPLKCVKYSVLPPIAKSRQLAICQYIIMICASLCNNSAKSIQKCIKMLKFLTNFRADNFCCLPDISLRVFLFYITLYNDLAVKYCFQPLTVWALAITLYALCKHLIIDPSHVISDLLR